MLPARGSKAMLQTTPPVGSNEYSVVLRTSKSSIMSFAEGLKVAVAKSQLL